MNLLTFSAPLWMPVLAWVAFRQRDVARCLDRCRPGLRLHRAGPPSPPATCSTVGELLAFGGALMLAIALIAVRATRGRPSRRLRVLFYYFALSSLLVLPLAFARLATAHLGPHLAGAFWLSGWPSSCPRSFIVYGDPYASAVRLSPIVYSVIVFSAVIDWVAWGSRRRWRLSPAWPW